MHRAVLVVALVTACGDDGSSGTGTPAALTRENLAGVWLEDTANGYRALEFRLAMNDLDLDSVVHFEGNGDTDPAELLRQTFELQGGPYIAYYETYHGINPTYVRVDELTTTTLRTLEKDIPHTYRRVDACPIDPRDGAWLWSTLSSESDLGESAIALDGAGKPAVVLAGPRDVETSVMYARRGPCGFIRTAPTWMVGNRQPRLAFGPDGQPRIAAERQGGVFFARFDVSMNDWIVTAIDGAPLHAGRPFGLAVASDGTAWVSHGYHVATDNTVGVAASHVTLDGTVTRHSIAYPTQGGALSRLVLDEQDRPHVVYATLDGFFVAARSADSTWTISPPIATFYSLDVTGFARSPTGEYHVVWSNIMNGVTDARYTTNASGSWATMSLGGGHGADVAVSSQGHVYITYAKLPEQAPYLTTNASGTWTSAKIETPGAPGMPAPTTSDDGPTSLAIGANDKLFVGFSNAAFATNAY